MIDSRAKGRTAELKCRDELRKLTGLMWERTPLSGALDAKHMMKGDVYVPQVNTKYCVEIKHYADDHVTTKLLTTKSVFYDWWAQTVREAGQMSKEPLLIFKHNRSKWFVAFVNEDVYFSVIDSGVKSLVLHPYDICICLLTDFCKYAEFKI
jgi:hypothetical protein